MITINCLQKIKENKKKFAAITAYDATFSYLFFENGIKVILVGDSLGMTIQGKQSTLSVKLNDIIYHTKCVRRGSPSCFLLSDLPFMSYFDLKESYKSSKKLIQAGANMVKLEMSLTGYWTKKIIENLTERSIPVCCHLGLTPQSINVIGKYKRQGKNEKDSETILKNSIIAESSGAQLLVLECVPTELAKKITESVNIPVIGIGSGPYTDGQILVMQDFLGITKNGIPNFAKNFLEGTKTIEQAIHRYIKEVETGLFPEID